jgi:starvation-inducible outer membrane lipoprotein
MVEYEFRVMDFTRHDRRDVVRQALTDAAEYGHWELHRTRIYVGGRRRTWLRRKIIRAPR